MCRLLAYASADPQAVSDLLSASELEEFRSLSSIHIDGWGMAWCRRPGATHEGTLVNQGIYRSLDRALDDPGFETLTSTALGDIGLVHLRWATDGYQTSLVNTHPFTAEGWAFAHNGSVPNARKLEASLSLTSRSQLQGNSDSERYFYYLMDRLREQRSVPDAVRAAVTGIRSLCGPCALNAILVSPEIMAVVQGRGGTAPPTDDLMASVSGPDDLPRDHLDAYFRLSYRVDDRALVVCSTGVPDEQWTVMPEDSVLVADRQLGTITIYSLNDERDGKTQQETHIPDHATLRFPV